MFLSVLVLLGLARVSLQQPGIDVLVFDCETMPDVCTNMCWAAFCSTTPDFAKTLAWDKPSQKEEDARRKTAGCMPRPNRCSTAKGHVAGYQCDEYPFASTAQADMEDQVTRCVPTVQNNRQGGNLRNFFAGKKAPLEFEVAFGNPGANGVYFCKPPADRDPSYCRNRGVGSNNERQWQGGSVAPTPPRRRRSISESSVPRKAHLFRTSSGMNVTMLSDRPIGQAVRSFKPIDLELAGSEADSADNWEKIEDTLDERYH